MMDLPQMGIRRRTPETQHWLFRAIVASAVTGGAIYVLAIHVVLPALASRLTPAQIGWFRQAFVHHPLAVLGESSRSRRCWDFLCLASSVGPMAR